MSDCTKRCSRCKEVKPVTEFFKQCSSKSGYTAACKSCTAPERKAKGMEYLNKNRTEINKRMNDRYHKRYKNDAEFRETRKLRGKAWKFGMSVDDFTSMYNNLMKKQNNCCAICERHISTLGKSFDVDHDHLTMKIRGLLCNKCNTTLGQMDDSPDRLHRAAKYLERF